MGEDAPARLGRKQIKALSRQAQLIAHEAEELVSALTGVEQAVDSAADQLKAQLAHEQLARMPLESLRPLVTGRIAWSALAAGGCRTVADAANTSAARLETIRGVGQWSAQEVTRAAVAVKGETQNSQRIAIDPENESQPMQQLIAALVGLDSIIQATRSILPAAQSAQGTLPNPITKAMPARSGLRWLLSGKRARVEARNAAHTLSRLLSDPQLAPLKDKGAARKRISTPTTKASKQRFLEEPARFLSLLDSRVGNVQSVHGDLDPSIVDRIEAIELDTSLLTVMLRRYQSFGARFVIAQGRVILGDDMGLGKTIQALAVMCHLAAKAEVNSTTTNPRFLVVAPASVLINWEREVAAKSDLPVFALHGSKDPDNLAKWQRDGGVAITTFEFTANIDFDGKLDLLVVDEAHYVKNPGALRTQRVEELVQRATRIMMMTGTPIENKAGEFVDLITMINPFLGAKLVESTMIVNPTEFRRIVAPAYLRRNAIDVLSELPERIEIDEWEEMTDDDIHAYRLALESGNFMAIRRAGFAAATTGESAKMNRLLEIVDEAHQAGHKTIVYSYFLDVLDAVTAALGPKAHGPMTGAMNPKARQELVDEFANAPAGSVLVSQVIAGGVGLNIQSASVVIMCEPQLKPSTENQAIARAHRMGQLKSVQVYRLLNPDSIDERIEEILSGKEIVFTNYARESDLADASGGSAIDGRATLRLIQGERDRLGVMSSLPAIGLTDGD